MAMKVFYPVRAGLASWFFSWSDVYMSVISKAMPVPALSDHGQPSQHTWH
jgi:hypothetical protein